jgi:hypothetical protein
MRTPIGFETVSVELETSDPVNAITSSWIQQAMIRSALRSGNEPLAVRFAISAGVRDENKLTDLVFYTRYPQRLGKKLMRGDPLIPKWLEIRDRVVRPVLRAPVAPSTPSAPATSAPKPAPSVKVADREVAATLIMAARKVPGLGITLEELLLRHKAEFGNIPIEILLAFIRKEAGTHLFDDATAGYWNKKTKKYIPQPKFYELGVFQTPAGIHGCVPDNGNRKCTYEPPGHKVEGSQFGKGWYRLTKTYPTKDNWKDPTMQVRIGLWDLSSTGERVAAGFPTLFLTKSSEWYLRMAVLYSFSKGAGWTRAYLSKYKTQLQALPESQRWDFLRGKSVYLERYGTKPRFDPENVDEKMALAAEIRAVRGAN